MKCAIDHLSKVDPKLAKVISVLPMPNISDHDDPFFFLVREIVGQMISAGVKKVIFDRLLSLCQSNITPKVISSLTIDQLKGIGLSTAKSSYILNLASSVDNGSIDFSNLNNLSDEEVIKNLISLKGIGMWTAKMYLIFFLKREDVLPYEDGAFLQAYKWLYNTKNVEQSSISRRCKKWKPYTSIGARYLYMALDSGLTKRNIKEFLGQ